jgi:hypothetical protein
MRRLLLAALLLPLSLGGATARLDAQEPGAAADGDYLWSFAPRGPFADERVVLAFALLVDTSGVTGAAGGDGSLFYAAEDVVEFINERPASESQLLLAAAGLADPSRDLIAARPCRFWADDAAVGAALSEALVDTLTGLGIDAEPCEQTSDTEAADLLVWAFGEDAPAIQPEPDLFGDSFLQIAELQSSNPQGADAASPPGTGDAVSPPGTGDAGLR